jgi:hypothetical protein
MQGHALAQGCRARCQIGQIGARRLQAHNLRRTLPPGFGVCTRATATQNTARCVPRCCPLLPEALPATRGAPLIVPYARAVNKEQKWRPPR